MEKPEPDPRSSTLDPRSSTLGIYVHIPFCSSICNYCNFNRGLFDAALKQRYVQALIADITRGRPEGLRYDSEDPSAVAQGFSPARPDIARGRPEGLRYKKQDPAAAAQRSVPAAAQGFSPARPDRRGDGMRDAADTIFFGGGTPSLLEPHEIATIVGAMRERFDLAPDAEITLEANPETVDRDRLERFRAAGVNRLSFGVQSFHDDELRRLGRIHSAERARAAVREARAAGFDNVSLDLMMWLPGQCVETWLANVDALIAAQPDHASLYLLELYPNAPLKEDMARGGWSQAPDDDAAEMYVRAMERLEAAGLLQYEISNVARPGRESRHNVKYWTDGEWLAFGCGAHATRDGVRWKNVAGTADYIERVMSGGDPTAERRVLSPDQRLEEALFTGLRLVGGIDLARIAARYGVDVWARYGDELQPFLDAGWLIHDGPGLRLTRAGMLMANEVMAVFV